MILSYYVLIIVSVSFVKLQLYCNLAARKSLLDALNYKHKYLGLWGNLKDYSINSFSKKASFEIIYESSEQSPPKKAPIVFLWSSRSSNVNLSIVAL